MWISDFFKKWIIVHNKYAPYNTEDLIAVVYVTFIFN